MGDENADLKYNIRRLGESVTRVFAEGCDSGTVSAVASCAFSVVPFPPGDTLLAYLRDSRDTGNPVLLRLHDNDTGADVDLDLYVTVLTILLHGAKPDSKFPIRHLIPFCRDGSYGEALVATAVTARSVSASGRAVTLRSAIFRTLGSIGVPNLSKYMSWADDDLGRLLEDRVRDAVDKDSPPAHQPAPDVVPTKAGSLLDLAVDFLNRVTWSTLLNNVAEVRFDRDSSSVAVRAVVLGEDRWFTVKLLGITKNTKDQG